MDDLRRQLAFFEEICEDPRRQLDAALESGKKAVGLMPYFCPEELVYAAGMQPFGLWGGQMQVMEAKRYFPAFYCSLLQTTLELGIRGKLDGLSAVVAPICCDSLKCMGVNWGCAVPSIPVFQLAHAQNRQMEAGVAFTAAQFQKLLRQLESLSGHKADAAALRCAVTRCNENRRALAAFAAAAGNHPELVSPAARHAVICAGYYMDRTIHTKALRALTETLSNAPVHPWPGFRLVVTGIAADAPALLAILSDNQMAVVADQCVQESVEFAALTPEDVEPIAGLARRMGQIAGCSVLFDPEKKRGARLKELVRAHHADGVLWVMEKFCDPEEFDFVPVRRELDAAGIPLLVVETDRQMPDYGQVRSAVEAFRERLEACRAGGGGHADA